MLFVAQLVHVDGTITYAGKDSWSQTETPEYVTTLLGITGKARYWKQKSMKSGYDVHLSQVNIIEVDIVLHNNIAKQINC